VDRPGLHTAEPEGHTPSRIKSSGRGDSPVETTDPGTSVPSLGLMRSVEILSKPLIVLSRIAEFPGHPRPGILRMSRWASVIRG